MLKLSRGVRKWFVGGRPSTLPPPSPPPPPSLRLHAATDRGRSQKSKGVKGGYILTALLLSVQSAASPQGKTVASLSRFCFFFNINIWWSCSGNFKREPADLSGEGVSHREQVWCGRYFHLSNGCVSHPWRRPNLRLCELTWALSSFSCADPLFLEAPLCSCRRWCFLLTQRSLIFKSSLWNRFLPAMSPNCKWILPGKQDKAILYFSTYFSQRKYFPFVMSQREQILMWLNCGWAS